MPNIKSAKKRVKTDKVKSVSNKNLISSMRTAIKKVTKEAKEKNINEENMKNANKRIDKALKKGLIHKNKAARAKSKLQKMVNNSK